jgi:hypothetical protein
MASTTVEYLLSRLRLKLGDTDSTQYRYTDAWLIVSLLSATISLQRWWDIKYLVDTDLQTITRNEDAVDLFRYEEPPVIQQIDEQPIILMAAIIIKSGQLEANSWNLGSWKDAEIAVSNIAGGDAKKESLRRDWDELMMYIVPPTKRLFKIQRLSFPDEE